MGVVDLAEALELDDFSFEVFGDVVGGDFRVVCELALCVDSLRSVPLVYWDCIGFVCGFKRLATLRSSGASLSFKLDS